MKVPHEILVLLFDGVVMLDAAGPMDVFSTANHFVQRAGGQAPYRIRSAAYGGEAVRCTNGLRLQADCELRAAGPADTVLTPGGPGTREALLQPPLCEELRWQAERGARMVGVCSGSFLLAEAGLLNGRKATTHWQYTGLLQRLYPRVEVASEPIFVEDGQTFTSAGVTAGIDLALHLVERDLGRELALEVARYLVVYLKRPGHQTQFSTPLQAQVDVEGPIGKVLSWIESHLDQTTDVERLAELASMSPRNFARRFRQTTGHSPARYLTRRRVEAASLLLSNAHDLPMATVARRCGFSGAEQLSRSFKRVHGIEPQRFREQFAPSQHG